MEEVLNTCGRISADTPFVVLVEDKAEGNMKFSFFLKKDAKEHSYTTYQIINEYEANLIISNVRGNGVKSSKPIYVGTYMKEYMLFVSFVVFKDDSEWNIDVHFMKKLKKDGNGC